MRGVCMLACTRNKIPASSSIEQEPTQSKYTTYPTPAPFHCQDLRSCTKVQTTEAIHTYTSRSNALCLCFCLLLVPETSYSAPVNRSDSLVNMRNNMALGWFYSPSQIGRYFLTRIPSLRPPRTKMQNPVAILRQLDSHQWLMFLAGFVGWYVMITMIKDSLITGTSD
jgi:hypothetical protein